VTRGNAPQERDAVEAVVAEHIARFGHVLSEAWGAFAATRTAAPVPMSFASASARGILVSDFAREPAHRIFGDVDGVWVDDRYGRPWVNLAGGEVQVRFRKLTSDLRLCRQDSDRATRLAFHLGDPALPGMPAATVLTAGYVLDLADQVVEHLALVCHVGAQVHYSFPIPVAQSATSQQRPRPPVQLPLAPLSPPVIRSAQDAAAERLVVRRSLAGLPQAGAMRNPRA
jgi:hypothetical protein